MCAASPPAPAEGESVIIPDTPAGQVLGVWLDAFNSGDRARIEGYHARYDPSGPVQRTLMFRKRSGGFHLIGIDGNDRLHIDFRVREKASPTTGIGHIAVTDADPPQVAMLVLQAIPPEMGAAGAAVKVDAAVRARVIDAIVTRLTELYVFPDVAEKMVEAVRAAEQRGEYEALESGYAFASQLTQHLQAVSHDKHLFVQCVPTVLPKEARDTLEPPPVDDEVRARLLRRNCGFEKVECLEGNIGYVKFNFFGPPEVCGATATAAMSFVAHTDAVIFDLRDNNGGTPDMVAWISSYLFAGRTHLNDIWERKHNKTTEFWTRPDVPGPKLARQAVYVLTSQATFSGAEEFTYNLKMLKRATIVGETTGGGAHPTMGQRVDDHFSVGVPFACAINPISKTSWEGTGVAPDVSVPAGQALDVARELAAAELEKRGHKE